MQLAVNVMKNEPYDEKIAGTCLRNDRFGI